MESEYFSLTGIFFSSVHRSRHEVYASFDECFIVFVNIALFSVCVQ